MDEFVIAIKDTFQKSHSKQTKQLKIRELLSLIMASHAHIEVINKITDDGDIQFKVSMMSMGVTEEVFIKYHDELVSPFVLNFLGEFLVRENISLFTDILTSIDPEIYFELVNKWNHKKFGMEISSTRCCVFKFHISLLQTILTEDIKSSLKDL